MPLRMKFGDRVCKVSLGFDVMTHPEYQRQGILSALGPHSTEYMVKNGFCIDYGTSTIQRFPVYLRLKMAYSIACICEPPMLIKVVNWGKLLKTRYRVPALIGNLFGYVWEHLTEYSSLRDTGMVVEQIQSFDEDIDDFWQKASVIKPIMVVRDRKFLNWRYVEKPGNEYTIFVARKRREIVGYIVVKLEYADLLRGVIVDLLTLPGEDIVTGALINRARSYLQESGADIISCLMLPDVPYYRHLKKMGFMRRRSGIQLNVRIFDPGLPPEFVHNPANWYYVRGDSDVI